MPKAVVGNGKPSPRSSLAWSVCTSRKAAWCSIHTKASGCWIYCGQAPTPEIASVVE